MTSENDPEIVPLVRSLYPNGPEEEVREAQQALGEYVAIVLRIFERLEREGADSPDMTKNSTIDSSIDNHEV